MFIAALIIYFIGLIFFLIISIGESATTPITGKAFIECVFWFIVLPVVFIKDKRKSRKTINVVILAMFLCSCGAQVKVSTNKYSMKNIKQYRKFMNNPIYFNQIKIGDTIEVGKNKFVIISEHKPVNIN